MLGCIVYEVFEFAVDGLYFNDSIFVDVGVMVF